MTIVHHHPGCPHHPHHQCQGKRKRHQQNHHHHHSHCLHHHDRDDEEQQRFPPTPPPPSPDIAIVHSDKISIISTENIRKLAILPRKKCTGFGSAGIHPNSTFVRRWISAVAVVDLLLFTSSLILSITTEKYVCHEGPVQLGQFSDLFLAGNESHPVTVYGYMKEHVLGYLKIESPISYHLAVILLLALGTTYFVLEVWLFCVLIKIAGNPRISSCIKWLSYRSLILCVTLLIAIYDVAFAHQATCSELVLVPLQVVRSVIGGVPVLWVIYWGWVSKGGGRW